MPQPSFKHLQTSVAGAGAGDTSGGMVVLPVFTPVDGVTPPPEALDPGPWSSKLISVRTNDCQGGALLAFARLKFSQPSSRLARRSVTSCFGNHVPPPVHVRPIPPADTGWHTRRRRERLVERTCKSQKVLASRLSATFAPHSAPLGHAASIPMSDGYLPRHARMTPPA